MQSDHDIRVGTSTFLFIGGPADGQRITVRQRNVIAWPVPETAETAYKMRPSDLCYYHPMRLVAGALEVIVYTAIDPASTLVRILEKYVP